MVSFSPRSLFCSYVMAMDKLYSILFSGAVSQARNRSSVGLTLQRLSIYLHPLYVTRRTFSSLVFVVVGVIVRHARQSVATTPLKEKTKSQPFP